MDGRQVLYIVAVVGGLVVQGVAIAVLFLILAWALCAYFMPEAACRRCKGRKVNIVTRFLGGKRSGLCGSCGGSGFRQVLGSRQVHKAVRSMNWRDKKS